MSRLVYWRMVPTEDNARAYSIRFKTKREAMDYWNDCPTDTSGLVEHFLTFGDVRRSQDQLNVLKYTAPQREEVEYEGGVFGLLIETMHETFTG